MKKITLKRISLLSALFITTTLSFSSCGKDDSTPPQIVRLKFNIDS